LGTGDTTTQSISTPTQVGTINDWAAVFAGNNYVAAVRADGSLYAWGFNSNGALGVGDKDVRNVPTLIADFNLLSA
jgi:alpha-tubulin suppressor-like RCC1 family protein